MNAPVTIPGPVRDTQAAEGLPRRAFTVAEVERMVACGILAEDDRLELLGGELVVMPAKGIRHETLKAVLLESWLDGRPRDLHIVPETTVRLGDDTFLEPDFTVFRTPTRLRSLTGETVLLAIEIADRSLGYDLYRKPAIYSRFGIRELWVIDAVRRQVHVHRQPGDGGYGDVIVVGEQDTVTAQFAPELALCLAALEIDWDV